MQYKRLAENVHLTVIEKDGREVTALEIIDQTALPGELIYKQLTEAEEMYEAIKKLEVRGAPAIGIFAAYAMFVLSLAMIKKIDTEDEEEAYKEFLAEFKKTAGYINSSRPTAVNLSWALKRVTGVAEAFAAKTAEGYDLKQLAYELLWEAEAIQQEDIDMCRAISENGMSLVKPGDGILTHCNAGPLATSKYGTAIGPVLLAKEQGIDYKVFSDETRPLLQGARLTSYELQKAGVDVTLICDNMASMVMKNGWVNACFVGCDRVAANGDAANKIGTSGVAIIAAHYGVPFYVLGPTSTIDMDCPDGDHIEIELRDEAEIREKFYEKPMALSEVKCYNPAFDVTDHSLIAGIVTEKGIARPPYSESLKALFDK